MSTTKQKTKPKKKIRKETYTTLTEEHMKFINERRNKKRQTMTSIIRTALDEYIYRERLKDQAAQS